MLKIQDKKFKIKFTEINIRHRIFEEESYITLIINTEFFPSLVDERVISGSVEVKLDLKNITKFEDLINQKYKGKIGNVTISVNNDGLWEHISEEDFEIKIGNIKNKEIDFKLKTNSCKLETKGTLVSLYTTSTSHENLVKNFDLKQFHNKPIIKEIGNSKIYKYYIK